MSAKSKTTQAPDFRTLQLNIFAKTIKFMNLFLPVHMGPRSNLLSQKKWSKSRDTVPLMSKRKKIASASLTTKPENCSADSVRTPGNYFDFLNEINIRFSENKEDFLMFHIKKIFSSH